MTSVDDHEIDTGNDYFEIPEELVNSNNQFEVYEIDTGDDILYHETDNDQFEIEDSQGNSKFVEDNEIDGDND